MSKKEAADGPVLRAMHAIHKCVAKNTPHLLAILRNELRITFH